MTTEQQKRYFEFRDEKSAKFWEVTTDDSAVTVRYGKIGTNGQSQTKELADVAAATKHVAKLVAEKTDKGYVESGQGSESLIACKPVPEATPAAQRKKTASAKKTAFSNPAKDPKASSESLLVLLNKDDTTNRLLARHPRATADLLEKLSHCSDEATRRNVASNPNTPSETFIKLGQQYPKEFLANPALDLLLMIQPTLMEEVPQALLIRLLKQDDCPISLLTWAASQPQAKVQLAVAMNAKAPEQALEKLRGSAHASVKDAVRTSISNIEQIPDPEMAFEQAVRDRLASMKSTELFEAWSEGDIGLAQWIALPLTFRLDKATALCFGPEHIARVLRDTTWTFDKLKEALPNYLYWDQVASDLATPSHVLEHMAKEPDSSVRWSLSRNPSTPELVLAEIALDSDPELRSGIAANPSTSVSILEALAYDSDASVRLSVARNPSTPSTVLSMFALDSDAWIRAEAARNTAMPMAELESLAKDSSEDVRLSAAENISLPFAVREALLGPLVEKLSKNSRIQIARNPSTVVGILKVLSKDHESEVRWKIAENKSTPVDVLEALANDSDISVRQSVALNPSAPVAVLEALAKELDSGLRWIRRSVAENPSTPASVLAELAQDWDSPVRELVARNLSTPSSWLVELAEDDESSVRAAVAANMTTPPDLLAQLSLDRTVDVLIAVANNPNTPLTGLLPLVKSKSGNVRSAIASQAHRSEKIFSVLSNDSNVDVRRALSNNFELETQVLDELALFVETEADWVNLLSHPNLSKQGVQFIADQLFNTSAADSPWFKNEVSTVPLDLEEAALSSSVLSYLGRNPNKSVLAKRPLAPVMALCAAQVVEPSRIVKVLGSTDWLVRAAVARNPGTPPNLLNKLSADAHPLVAALAKSNMSSNTEVGK